MKQVFSLLLTLCLLITSGCVFAPAAKKADGAKPTAQIVTVQPESAQATPVEALPDDVAAAEPISLTEAQKTALAAMHPVLDSVLRSVGVGDDAGWPAEDQTDALWSALYLLGVNWRSFDPRMSTDGARLIVPRRIMNEWAEALTADFSHLPDLAPDITFLRYDAAAQTYSMELSDSGAAETRIDEMDANADGTYAVRLGLYDDYGERVGGLDFVLIENPFLGGPSVNPQLDDPEILPVENPEFLYTVLSAAAD